MHKCHKATKTQRYKMSTLLYALQNLVPLCLSGQKSKEMIDQNKLNTTGKNY